jgi:hypothetical protein
MTSQNVSPSGMAMQTPFQRALLTWSGAALLLVIKTPLCTVPSVLVSEWVTCKRIALTSMPISADLRYIGAVVVTRASS